jgi:hypothetical protein
MRRRKLFLISLVALVLAISTGAIVVLLNPLRGSKQQIRASLLRHTPIGSTPDQVRTFVRAAGWEPEDDKDLGGYLTDAIKESHGKTAIFARLGDYQGIPWRHWVEAIWVFDANGALIDILIWKFIDSP